MKYEVIRKEVLDEICSNVLKLKSQIENEESQIKERESILSNLNKIYNAIQANRTTLARKFWREGKDGKSISKNKI